MSIIKIVNRFTGNILFEHQRKDNTIALTVKVALEAGINLRGANLSFADLRGANLSSSDLRGTDLRYTDLRYTNLSFADLRDANLSYTNLSYANLSSSDLRGTDLRGTDLRYTNLSSSDLRGVDIDFSRGWIFACRHSKFIIGISFARQVLAHLCSCKSDDPEVKKIQDMILEEAKLSHRAKDLGLLEDVEDE